MLDRDRATPENHAWVKAINERDSVCVFCDSDDRLQAHHVQMWGPWPELRYQTGNGLLVCWACHAHIHGGRIGK